MYVLKTITPDEARVEGKLLCLCATVLTLIKQLFFLRVQAQENVAEPEWYHS